jgi:membrane protease YdiL (CAAX protease family)
MQRDPVRAAIQAGVFLLLYVVAVYLLGPLALLAGGYLVGLTVGSLVAAALATAFAMAIFGGHPLIDVGLCWNGFARANVLWGIAGGTGAAVLVIAPAVLFHAAHFVPSPEAGANWRTLLFVPFLLFCGAAGEELLFHGFGFQVMLREIGTYATVLPVGILFGFLHSNNPNASRLGLANTAGFGILFGIAFLRSHDLWLPMGLHFGWNFTLPLFGVNLSGITIKPTGVTLLWNVGSLWSGGDYGPEASVLTSGILALLLLYILKIPVARQHAPLLDTPPDPTPEPPALSA